LRARPRGAPAMRSYHSLLQQVQRKRLGYVNRVCALLAVLLAVLLAWPLASAAASTAASAAGVNANTGATAGGFWWSCVLGSFVWRGPVVFVSLACVKAARQRDSTVAFAAAKTALARVAAAVVSRRFCVVAAYHVASAALVFGCHYAALPVPLVRVAKEYRQRNFFNDDWVFYAYCGGAVAVVYAAQHLGLQRNRLGMAAPGVAHLQPLFAALFGPVPRLVAVLAVLAVGSSAAAALAYYSGGARTAVYRVLWLPLVVLGMDPHPHPTPLAAKWAAWRRVVWPAFHLVLGWELTNHWFNVYAQVGCLDGAKPISAYSADPLNTLVQGLRDPHPHTQFTAFQELAYIASLRAPDATKLRAAIYNASPTFGPLWGSIFDECALVVRDTTVRVSYRLRADLRQLAPPQAAAPWLLHPSGDIFAKAPQGASSEWRLQPRPKPRPESPLPQTKAPAALPAVAAAATAAGHYWRQMQTRLDALSAKQVLPPFARALATRWFCKYRAFRDEVLTTSVIGGLFRVTVQTDCQLRVLDPVTFGNAVLAVSHLVVHAVEEDKRGTILNREVAEVLTLLEKPIRAMKNYTQQPPASIDLTPAQRQSPVANDHLVAYLHDLVISEFFEICVKYNYTLNDLLLPPRVYKLAKRVVDAAIAQTAPKRQNLNQA
jgi:nucleoporin NDC1